TNERDARFFDLYEMDLAAFQRKLVYQNTAGYEIGDISRDRKYVAFNKPNTTNDSDLYLYDATTREVKHLTPHTGDVNYTVAEFDPGSRYLYYLTDEGSEFAHIARYELATGKKETVEKADWDVLSTYFSHGGKYRVVSVNADASTVIKVSEEKTGRPVPLPSFPGGEIRGVNISRSEKLMAFYVNGDRSPANLHVYDFATRSVTQLTQSLNPEVNPEDLVEAQVVRYKSFDGMEIPALLFRPQGATASSKAPAIVEVHGGPGGQSRRGYSALYQFLVNHGYAVLRVNNRGSSGYGKTFYAADDQKHGREPLWDCVQAKKYLASLDYVDGSKIAIQGGSYGGYMVLA
ncbi:MAG: prolyl oligopeptidase family serine peptidase, partial [Nevskiales bacterium]